MCFTLPVSQGPIWLYQAVDFILFSASWIRSTQVIFLYGCGKKTLIQLQPFVSVYDHWVSLKVHVCVSVHCLLFLLRGIYTHVCTWSLCTVNAQCLYRTRTISWGKDPLSTQTMRCSFCCVGTKGSKPILQVSFKLLTLLPGCWGFWTEPHYHRVGLEQNGPR